MLNICLVSPLAVVQAMPLQKKSTGIVPKYCASIDSLQSTGIATGFTILFDRGYKAGLAIEYIAGIATGCITANANAKQSTVIASGCPTGLPFWKKLQANLQIIHNSALALLQEQLNN